MIKAGAKSDKQSAADAQKQSTGELPSSVRSTYNDIFKLVDDKQYKRAIKNADAVLKKVPNHAPAMSMKALAMYNMGKKEEAHDLAKSALKHDLKNYVCWHVFGSLHRADNNYPEALKCYRNALRFQPENLSAMRDLAMVQIMLRDYRGHHETRRSMLTSNPKMPTNWVGFAVAHHLAGNHDMALAVFEQYESTLDPSRLPSYEVSELQLLKVRMLEQQGRPLKALELMTQPAVVAQVVDQLAYQEKLATLLLRVGKLSEAASLFADLLRINSEHYGYHRGLQVAVLGDVAAAAAGAGAEGESSDSSSSATSVAGMLALTGCNLPSNAPAVLARLSPSQVDALLGLYVQLAAQYPRSRAVKRIPLDLLPHGHAAFTPLLGAYLRAGLRKGLPSLFADLKQLYRSPAERGQQWAARQAHRSSAPDAASGKVAVLGGLVASYLAAVQGGAPLPVSDVEGEGALEALAARLRAAVAASPVLAGTGGDALAAVQKHAISAEALRALWTADARAAAAAAPSATGAGAEPAAAAACPAAAAEEDPSLMPWLLLFAARHADEAGQSDAALAHIDAAIAHTPTIQDLYVARGRVLKHRGQLWAAADAVNQGRVLDLADRYLNVKAVQYLLRAGRVDQAHRTLALFTRADSKELSGDPLGNVGSLEILWYQLEVAAAYERAGNYGLALKHYVKVDTIFKAFAEDQFDFHAYSLRKGPLRAYADVLALSDGLKHHSSFLKAMAGAARCYLALHEDAAARAGSKRWEEPALAERVAALAREVDAAGAAAPAGARAVVSSVRIAQGQVENARAAAASITVAREAKAAKGGAGAGAGGDDEDGAGGGEDKDLLGDELAAKANPLAEAQVYVAALLHNLPQEVPEAAAVSRAVGDAAVGRLPTPNGLVTAVPTSSSAKLFRGWNAPPEFVAEAHALAARLAVERGKLLPAVTSMLASQRAAAAAPSTALAAAIVKGRPAHHLHPASLAASVRTYRAIEASLAEGAASPLARVHEQLRAILRRPDQLGDAASTGAFVAALAPQAAVVLELADALQSVAGSGAAAPAVAPTAFMTGAAGRAVLRRAVGAALSGAGSAAGVEAATKQVAGIAALAHADAATAPVVAAEQTCGAAVVVVGEKDKPAAGAGAAAAPAKSA